MTISESDSTNPIAVIEQKLVENAARFAQLGLRPVVETRSSTEATEVSIYFYAHDDIVDVLEFFVLEDGKPTASPAEFRHWITASIQAVIDDRERSAGP